MSTDDFQGAVVVERNKDKPEALDNVELQAHPQFTATLANGLAVLGCFADGPPLLGNKELSELLGMTRPTVSRLTFTLVGLGYLRRDTPTGKYGLGPAVLSLGYPLLSRLMIRQVGSTAMMQLASYAHGPVSVGVRDRLQVVYVETTHASESNETLPGIGSRRPFLRTAIGRALLYALDAQERALVLERLQATHTDEWDTYHSRLEGSFAEIDEHGFCLVEGDWRPTLAAVAVPMKASINGMRLAFNLTLPRYAVDRQQLMTDLGPRLLDLVHKMEHLLGVSQR
ncbi:IclR family transcriptional regulator [Allopusillimonas ginsengisoli]|uniref:IclR family transcriptional regulator n=1 Tax=Allopusillimonas ginsengisoli TaxID=453575 RepID=UPI00101FF0CC|nr:IclR family transcriptional regulator [Allopusillimonas ginsengisoli]TEA78213.1 IclR family transcriptional regulator [Allopusillimonas ginsengisoli]